jgi:hypothetical protein
MVVSSGSLSLSDGSGLPAANNGCGGRGRFGEPPYCDEGVPGLGLPLMSAGSNDTLLGGGLPYSFDTLEGMKDIVGDSDSRDVGL